MGGMPDSKHSSTKIKLDKNDHHNAQLSLFGVTQGDVVMGVDKGNAIFFVCGPPVFRSIILLLSLQKLWQHQRMNKVL